MKRVIAKGTRGFTIVELLIVIVVIAILAAISIVAYTGIQNRANDTAVQSDIRNLAGKVREYQVLEDRYPHGETSGGSPITGMTSMSLSRQSYLTSVTNNFYYCRGIVSDIDTFGIIAVSTSGTIYAYTSATGSVQAMSGTWATGWGNANICPLVGVPTTSTNYSYSAAKTSSGWKNWSR